MWKVFKVQLTIRQYPRALNIFGDNKLFLTKFVDLKLGTAK